MSYNPKIHQIYKHPDTGEYLPGVTTITARHPDGKAALTAAAVKLTKQGLDYKGLWEHKAMIGTCCHDLIHHHIMGIEKPSISHYSQAVLSPAKKGLRAFKKWEKTAKPVYYGSELVAVNSLDNYGGTIDIWADVYGGLRVIDIKTGGWWATAEMQIVAYQKSLISEITRSIDTTYSKHKVLIEDPIGLQIDCINGSFTVHHLMRDTIDKRWNQFLNLLEGWQLERDFNSFSE